ncbi:MAG TPA: AAA family ATPase [Candidatus Melainabacteria bacterium]|nr:AAA family ATPase [Candidatus Melainabacteria bacterium]
MDSLVFDENLALISSEIEKAFNDYPFPEVMPEHVLLAILRQNCEIFSRLANLLSLKLGFLEGSVVRFLSGGTSIKNPSYDKAEWQDITDFIFIDADKIRTILGHEKLGVEHVFCSLSRVTGTVTFEILQDLAMHADLIAQAISVLHEDSRQAGTTLETRAHHNQGSNDKIDYGNEFGIDLTALALEAKLDPVIGRDEEIRRALNILARRTKNNPVLVGEGKTAIAEGLAIKIAAGDVPVSLRGHRILSIDVGSLVAGTAMRGAFESRLKNLIEAATEAGRNTILFIDELHLLVGAGAVGDGALDAGNILKPYLARGLIRCLGATTISEYSRYIEKDPALARRFQKVMVKEPSPSQTLSILRGLRSKNESYHGVRIHDSALVAAAELSGRYLTDRKLPDKAVDLIDEAASRKGMELDSTPIELDSINENMLHLELERASLEKDEETKNVQRLSEIDSLESLKSKSDEITLAWRQSREGHQKLGLLKKRMERLENEIARAKRDKDFKKAAVLERSMADQEKVYKEVQESCHSNKDFVGDQDIARLLSEWTGIPVSSLEATETNRLLSLEQELNASVVGQDEALKAVAQSIRIARTGLASAERPIGSFLFAGPTGVGKTEVAKAVAKALFPGAKALIRLDMSEYFDKYTVARLIGASPGYVGFEDGGQLTEAVKANPYSCILFDEIEKAHSDIYNILLQILDEGRLTDARGRVVDFRNTVIILTSNIGADLKAETTSVKKNPRAGFDLKGSRGIDTLPPAFRDELQKVFKPELLNRIDEIVLFKPLNSGTLSRIVQLQLNELRRQLNSHGHDLFVNPRAVEHIAELCADTNYGARPIKRMIRNLIQVPISELILENGSGSKTERRIEIDLTDGEITVQTN